MWRWWLPMLIWASLSGCSSYQLAYNHLDRLLFSWVEDYVDLTSAQRAVLEPQVQQWHTQHRQTQLPRYKDLLVAMRTGLQSAPLDAVLAEQWQAEAETRWLELRSSLVPLSITLLEQLDIAQQQALLKALRRRIEVQRDEYLERTPAEQAEHLEDLYRQRMKRWIGRLDHSQSRDLNRLVVTLTNAEGLWLGYRRRWVDALEQALIVRSNRHEFEKQITALTLSPQSLLTAAQRAAMAASRRQRGEYLLALVNGLSVSQRDQLLSELDALIEAAEQLLQSQD